MLGGENMRIKGLKDRTKDCDIVTTDDYSSNHISTAFEKMGYQSIDKKIALKDDHRVDPSIIMVHSGRSNIDIFTKSD